MGCVVATPGLKGGGAPNHLTSSSAKTTGRILGLTTGGPLSQPEETNQGIQWAFWRASTPSLFSLRAFPVAEPRLVWVCHQSPALACPVGATQLPKPARSSLYEPLIFPCECARVAETHLAVSLGSGVRILVWAVTRGLPCQCKHRHSVDDKSVIVECGGRYSPLGQLLELPVRDLYYLEKCGKIASLSVQPPRDERFPTGKTCLNKPLGDSREYRVPMAFSRSSGIRFEDATKTPPIGKIG